MIRNRTRSALTSLFITGTGARRRFSRLRAVVGLCLLLFLPVASLAIECTIGDASVSIPPPEGFTNVREVSEDTFSMFKEMCPPANRLLAVFVTNEDAGRLLRGGEAELDRYMTVQSVSKLEDVTLAKHQFAELRSMLRKEYDSLFQKQRQAIDEAAKTASRGLSRHAELDIAMRIGGVVPLGIDAEDASSITMSQLAKFDVSVEGEKSEHISAGTTVAVLAKGKVVYLNVFRTYREDADVAWTRSTAKSWIQQILDANETVWPVASGSIVPRGTPINAVTKELLASEQAEFSLDGHPKAHGLNISVKYPSAWKAEEGIRPHIVQKFTGSNVGGISPSCMIIVQKLPSWASLFLEGELGDDVLSEALHEMVPPDAVYLDGGKTKLDGENGAWLKYYYEAERSGLKFGMYSLQYVLFYGGRMLAVQCSVGGVADDKAMLEDAFQSYLPVFQVIGNSIVIHDKWAKSSSGSSGSLMSDVFGEYWFITLLISALLTWGIGLAPPLITRFGILHHPMTKPGALVFVVVFWLFNVLLFTALGSTSRTHGALLLVAWASFAILRKGSRAYDEERKQKAEEEEKRNREREEHKRERERMERERAQWQQQAHKAREDARKAQEEADRQAEEARRRAEEQRRDHTNHDPRVRKDERYYASVLGLTGRITRDDVRKKYRDLAAKYHPDRVNHLGDRLKETAEREMKAINEAFEYFKKKYGI